MKRSLLARLIIVAFIVTIGLSLTFALDNTRSSALTPLPEEADRTFGQSDSLFYAFQPGEQGVLYLSQDGRSWRELPASFNTPIRALAAPALDSDTLYVATHDGLYVTRDAGQSWNRAAATMENPIAALAAAPNGTLFAVSEQGALYRSSDFGASATRVGSEQIAAPVRDLAASPNGQLLFAATDAGLLRSENAGTLWTAVEGVPASSQVLFDVAEPTLLYAATRDSGLYRSIDAGQTWEPSNEGLGFFPGTSLAVTALAQDPQQPETLYVATAYILGESERHMTPAAILMSPDRGTQWISVAELALSDPVVTALLPETGPGSGIRAVSAEGTTVYRMDADRALELLQSSDPATQLKGAKILSVAAVPTQADTILPYLYHETDGQLAYYAARALGHIGGEAVTNELVGIIGGDASTIVKLRALMALEMIAEPNTVPALTSTFQQDALASASAEALAAIGSDEAWRPLVDALGHQELSAQQQAAMAAFESHSEAALEPVVSELSSTNPTIRANAARLLAWMGEEKAIAPLRALLDDKDATVRSNAIFALGELRDRDSIERLREIAASDGDAEVRRAASDALVSAARDADPMTVVAPPATGAERTFLERIGAENIGWLKAFILTLTAVLALFVLAAQPRHSTPQAH